VQVYITPLLGAYLADAVMGRFWVILVFSLIYFVVSAIFRLTAGSVSGTGHAL
jgi:dipeptide/tripeptide permease